MSSPKPSIARLAQPLSGRLAQWSHHRANDCIQWGHATDDPAEALRRTLRELENLLGADVPTPTHSTDQLLQNVVDALDTVADLREDAAAGKFEAPTRTLILTVEPFLFKLLACVEQERYQTLTKALNHSKRKPTLQNAIQSLVKARRLDAASANLSPEQFESTTGWDQRSSIDNAIRDVFDARNASAHGAPSLVSMLGDKEPGTPDNFHKHRALWQSALVLMLYCVDRSRDDIIRIRLRSHGVDFQDALTSDILYGQLLHNRYLITGVLGHGGMGKVYEGLDTNIGRKVAIKVPFLEGADAKERWTRECRALQQIHHSNVVKITDLIDDPWATPGENNLSVDYLVMEYIEGHDLRALIQAGRFSAKLALTVLEQVGRALGELHAKRLIHRDVKPENIRISRQGQSIHATLLDLGIALPMDTAETRLTSTAHPIGTRAYMSPEQLRGSRKITSATDYYSLGVVFHEMLTQHTDVCEDSDLRASGLSPAEQKALLLLLRNLVATSPQKRPESSRALSDHIRHIELRLGLNDTALFAEPEPQTDRIAALKPAQHLRPDTHPPSDAQPASRTSRASALPHAALPDTDTELAVTTGAPQRQPARASTAPQVIQTGTTEADEEAVTRLLQPVQRDASTPFAQTPAPPIAPMNIAPPTRATRPTTAAPARIARTLQPRSNAPQATPVPKQPHNVAASARPPQRPSSTRHSPRAASARQSTQLIGREPPELAAQIDRLGGDVHHCTTQLQDHLAATLTIHDHAALTDALHRLTQSLAALHTPPFLATFVAGHTREQLTFLSQHLQRPRLIAPLDLAHRLLLDVDRHLHTQHSIYRARALILDQSSHATLRQLKQLQHTHRRHLRIGLLDTLITRQRQLNPQRLAQPPTAPTPNQRLAGERTRLCALLNHRHLDGLLHILRDEQKTLASQRDTITLFSADSRALRTEIARLRATIP